MLDMERQSQNNNAMDLQTVYSNRTFPFKRRKLIRKRKSNDCNYRRSKDKLAKDVRSLTETKIRTDLLLNRLITGAKNCIDSLFAQNEQRSVEEGLLTQLRGFSKITVPASEQCLFTSLENLLPIQELHSTSDNDTMELFRSELLSNSLLFETDPSFLLMFFYHLEKLLAKHELALDRDSFKKLIQATWSLC